MERLSERSIRFLDLRFVDVLGTVKSITIINPVHTNQLLEK